MGGMAMRQAFSPRRWAGLTVPLAGVVLVAGVAGAQASPCAEIGKTLQERKSIVERLQKLGKGGKIDPRQACTSFGQLVSNGQTVIKWMDANASWCQVPDSFVESMKTDIKKSAELKAKACKVAAQQTEMERRARQGGGPGQGGQAGGLLGGGGLEGAQRLPQGVL